MFTGADPSPRSPPSVSLWGEICLTIGRWYVRSVPGSALSITTSWGPTECYISCIHSQGSGITPDRFLIRRSRMSSDSYYSAQAGSVLNLIHSDRKLTDIKLDTLHSRARRAIRTNKISHLHLTAGTTVWHLNNRCQMSNIAQAVMAVMAMMAVIKMFVNTNLMQLMVSSSSAIMISGLCQFCH